MSDGPTRGGAESPGAGPDPTLVHHAAADGLSRAPQQTRRHLLLLLGGSYTRGMDADMCLQPCPSLMSCLACIPYCFSTSKVTKQNNLEGLSHLLLLLKASGQQDNRNFLTDCAVIYSLTVPVTVFIHLHSHIQLVISTLGHPGIECASAGGSQPRTHTDILPNK